MTVAAPLFYLILRLLRLFSLKASPPVAGCIELIYDLSVLIIQYNIKVNTVSRKYFSI